VGLRDVPISKKENYVASTVIVIFINYEACDWLCRKHAWRKQEMQNGTIA